MQLLKLCFLVFFCIFMHTNLSAGQGEEKADCSNILDVLQSYFDLSFMDHALLSMSADRFSSSAITFLSEDLVADEQKIKTLENLKEDIAEMNSHIAKNTRILVQKSELIQKVLPGCLK